MPRKLAAVPRAALLAGALAASALAAPGQHPNRAARGNDARAPVKVTVFSPGPGDHSGAAGVGFIVDVALDSTNPRGNALLSRAEGYTTLFNDPLSPTFHPGPDPAAAGLVVLLSRTPATPGTPFQGPRTNLAGLFQINGVAQVHGHAETWNTWQPGKPLFGLNQHAKLTVYVVAGTAPSLVPPSGLEVISNTVHVPFTIAG